MDCRQCHDELTAYIDGELSPPVQEQMRVHLDQCPPCREELRDLLSSAAFVTSNTRQIEPVPEIWNNLRSRIAEMPSPSESGSFLRFLTLNRWGTSAATLAATVLIALGLVGYLQYHGTQKQFESYMTHYIRTRTIKETIHSAMLAESEKNPPNPEVLRSAARENPFAETRPSPFGNPFQTETR